MTKNVLTTPGAPPFHAVLEIQPDPKGPSTQHGRVELFWAAPDEYVLDITSPGFSQHLVAHEGRVSETDGGDYYPAWLHYFVLALFNPVDRAAEILTQPNGFHDQPAFVDTCYEWDSRANVVTDAERDADICFEKRQMQLAFTRDYMRYLSLSDFQPFHDKSIARQYAAALRVSSVPHATLSVLEDWRPDPSKLLVATPATTSRLMFHARSAAEATASIVSKPETVNWPTTREGARSGKVLVHVVTDTTGKVREAVAPESDNDELKRFAAELAKRYVFSPLVIDGQAVQAEMPLILAFQLDATKPHRTFNDAETRAVVKGCSLPREIRDPVLAGQNVAIRLLIAEDGHISEVNISDRRLSPLTLFHQLHDCRFAPYMEDGKPSAFRATFDVLAK